MNMRKKLEKRSVLAARIAVILTVVFLSLSQGVEAQIAQRGSATTALSTTETVTVSKPVGLIVGDVMIAIINQADNDGNTLGNATGSGWTFLSGAKYYETGNGDDEWWGTVLYKVANASDVFASDFIFTGDNSGDDMQAGIVAFQV